MKYVSQLLEGKGKNVWSVDPDTPVFQALELMAEKNCGAVLVRKGVPAIGANDVVNPLAREADPSIPIAGMPILNVDMARAVVVIKRSLSPGFAGIANPLFAADNSLMLFGDAKQMITELTAALKEI